MAWLQVVCVYLVTSPSEKFTVEREREREMVVVDSLDGIWHVMPCHEEICAGRKMHDRGVTGVMTCGSKLGGEWSALRASVQIPCTDKKAPISPTIVPSFPVQSSCTCIFVQKRVEKREKENCPGIHKWQSFFLIHRWYRTDTRTNESKAPLLLCHNFVVVVLHTSPILFSSHHHDVCPSCSFLGTPPFFDCH